MFWPILFLHLVLSECSFWTLPPQIHHCLCFSTEMCCLFSPHSKDMATDFASIPVKTSGFGKQGS